MIQVQDLYIYPIKSLGGYRVEAAEVTARGLAHDRRWMLVDEQHRFLTQREHPVMAMLQVQSAENGFRVFHRHRPDQFLEIPWTSSGAPHDVAIWDDHCEALRYAAEADAWFTQQLGIPCSICYMPDSSKRPVDRAYAPEGAITSFSDGYPMLVIAQASLDDLNGRLPTPVPMNRFRPNLVISGTEAFAEDRMASFEIRGISFHCVKPCARCVMTTIDQHNGTGSPEPLRTLANYRRSGHKVLFGQNLLIRGTGTVRTGDQLTVRYRS